MTFRCQMCFEVSKPHEKQHKVISAFRNKVYGDSEQITTGFEIVKELVMCPRCVVEIADAENQRENRE